MPLLTRIHRHSDAHSTLDCTAHSPTAPLSLATAHCTLPTAHYFPFPQPEGTPAVSSGLTMTWDEIDVLVELALGEP